MCFASTADTICLVFTPTVGGSLWGEKRHRFGEVREKMRLPAVADFLFFSVSDRISMGRVIISAIRQ